MTEIEKISYSVKRYGEFLDAIEQFRTEFDIWKLETDLTHVKVDFRNIPVSKLGLKDWLTWRLQSELNDVEVHDETTIDVEYCEYETIN